MVILAACSPQAKQPAPAAVADADWPVFGHDPGGAQFSPLAQITPANLGDLKLAWEHHSGDYTVGAGIAGTSLEVTPLKVNGRLYYCTPLDRVFALDPVTGRAIWTFDPYAKPAGGTALVSGPGRQGICRGVAYWRGEPSDQNGAACTKRIFRADPAGRLFAIDADTGRSCRDFGPRAHPGYVAHGDYENDGEGYLGVSSPPAVIGDTVIIGGSSNDGVQDANDGIVRAFDARTGALKWSFNPIPEAYRRKTGAANVWSTISVDPKNGLVFLPTTSPSTDYYGGGRRRFDMPLASAVVALNAETGAVAWSYQTVRHDLWDYDLPGHPLLVTIRKDGRPMDVVIQQTKTGHLFVLDRLTGRPVFPIQERPVPPSTLPGETAAAIQPVPRLPQPFARTEVKRSNMFGVVGLDKLWCRRQFDKMRYQGLFTPPGLDEYLQMPSTLGGGNWGGAAYDPGTNSVIVKASNIATRLHLVRKDPNGKPQAVSDFMTRPLEGPYGVVGDWFVSPLGIPCTPPPYGTLTAISMDTGKVRWQVPLGQTRRNGVTAPAFLGWGSPTIGGPTVTASGLVFIGGSLDGKLRAFDARTGRELWKAQLPAPGMAVPMTYAAGGRQFVVIAAGGSGLAETKQGDAIMAFALPAR